MAGLVCVDGRTLDVLPVPCVDRDGVPYEVTLRLERDGEVYGEVGERCGFFLATTTARLRAAREAGGEYPACGLEAGLRAWAVDRQLDSDEAWAGFERYVPRDRELFCFRARDPDDLTTAGELRVVLRHERTWDPPGADGGRGRWRLRSRAVVEAWGSNGAGVRAVVDSAGLLAFLEQLLRDCAAVGASYDGVDEVAGLRRPVG